MAANRVTACRLVTFGQGKGCAARTAGPDEPGAGKDQADDSGTQSKEEEDVGELIVHVVEKASGNQGVRIDDHTQKEARYKQGGRPSQVSNGQRRRVVSPFRCERRERAFAGKRS